GGDPETGAARAAAADRAPLAVFRSVPAADAARAGPGHRGPGAGRGHAGALGARAGTGPGLADGAAVRLSLAWPADLERAGLVPGDRGAVHRRGLDLRASAQCAAQAPGVRLAP